jgi:4-hydroxybenzoate polyprenyltransferase
VAKNSKVVAWLQLLRLPNVFTAVADVMMGYLVTHGNLAPPTTFAALAVVSCLLYLSGMVLNDVFDADVDARDRPGRPIPSGRVSLNVATAVGWAMLASGILAGWYLTYVFGHIRPGTIATLLGVCVILYDAVLKRTSLAPLLMGACRALNVMLGMSLADLTTGGVIPMTRPWLSLWLIALGIGIYITGVTIFARTEARESSRPRLIGGMTILLLGIALLAATPLAVTERPVLAVSDVGWYLLWAALGLITARRCAIAVFDPAPQNVQAAVRHCVQSIIVLDAAVCVGYAGPFWGFIVLTLLIPTLLLTVWLDAT